MPATIPVRAITSVVVNMPTPTMVNGKPVGWLPTSVTRSASGFFVIAMGPHGSAMTDVTYFRSVPTMLDSFTFIDPFTYGTAVINFPQITVFDDLDGLGFLGTEANPADVDIWWYEAAVGTDFINPLTNQYSLTYGAGTKLWEGFIASREITGDEKDSNLQIQCQGALFQLEHYKQKPFYPRRPYVLERLIYEVCFPYAPDDTSYDGWPHELSKPSLRTRPVFTDFPAGWTKTTPARTADEPNLYTPVIPPNRLWTGYTTRNTGTWEPTLTGYIQDALAVMLTTDDCGVTAGNQWALRCETDRLPVLEIRDRNRTPDFEVWAGTPGITLRVNEDYTQIENSLYGEGTGVDGALWRNAYMTGPWNRTDYEPLAALDTVYPDIDTQNVNYNPDVMVHESKTQYSSGMSLAEGITSAEKRLDRVSTAGLAGELTLRVDPAALSRFKIKAGMTVKVKGIKGSGTTGINFHIAEAVINVAEQSVNLKVDTKYRDLLTLEEARARNIDPLTPSKLLQVNKRSVMIEDIIAPWDYHAGSGYVPQTARYGKNKREGITSSYNFFNGMPATTRFPWESWTQAHPPGLGSYNISADGYTKGPYVRIDADHALSRRRWSFVQVLTASKGTIRRIEFATYDINGNVLEIPFHVSLYFTQVNADYMPHEGTDYSPFRTGAFESITTTGTPNPPGAINSPDESLIIGWGNSEQKAGYSPGLSSEGYSATGKLIDEATWTFDNTDPKNLELDLRAAEVPGGVQRLEALTIWAAIYAEHTDNVFVLGRLYKQEQAGA